MKAADRLRGLMRRSGHAPLPYPSPFSQTERIVIDHALRLAMDELVSSATIDLATCDEVAITSELQSILNRMLDAEPAVVPGFSKAVFQTVVRGAELHNHDGTCPEKRPDLQFRSPRATPMLRYPDQHVLLVECKIVDRSHTMARYGQDGLSRFVDGTYAWAVSSAIMLGYARTGYHPVKELAAHLKKFGADYALVGTLRRTSSPVESYETVHERTLPVLPTGHLARIALCHIWFKVA